MYKEIMNKVQDAVTCVSSNTRDSKLAHDIASNTAQDSSQQTDVLDRAHEKLLFNRKNEEEVTKEVSRIYSTIVANAEKLLHAAVEAQQVIENKLDHAQAFSKGLRDERTMMSKTAQKQRLEAIAFKESSIATAKADYQTVIELATSVKLEELTSCQETHKDRMRLLDLDASAVMEIKDLLNKLKLCPNIDSTGLLETGTGSTIQNKQQCSLARQRLTQIVPSSWLEQGLAPVQSASIKTHDWELHIATDHANANSRLKTCISTATQTNTDTIQRAEEKKASILSSAEKKSGGMMRKIDHTILVAEAGFPERLSIADSAVSEVKVKWNAVNDRTKDAQATFAFAKSLGTDDLLVPMRVSKTLNKDGLLADISRIHTKCLPGCVERYENIVNECRKEAEIASARNNKDNEDEVVIEIAMDMQLILTYVKEIVKRSQAGSSGGQASDAVLITPILTSNDHVTLSLFRKVKETKLACADVLQHKDSIETKSTAMSTNMPVTTPTTVTSHPSNDFSSGTSTSNRNSIASSSNSIASSSNTNNIYETVKERPSREKIMGDDAKAAAKARIAVAEKSEQVEKISLEAKTVKSITGVALVVPDLDTVPTWSWSKGINMCIGKVRHCNNDITSKFDTSCTSTAFGPCLGTKEESPTAYIHNEFMGTLMVDIDQYLSCNSNAGMNNACNYMKTMPFSGPGYRDYADNLIANTGTKYSYMMIGNTFGDLSNAGGYVGISSYLNTGKKDIHTSYNQIYLADTNNAKHVTRADSKMGAPIGPKFVCISDIDDKGNCGTTKKRTVRPDEYKFSVFGTTKGMNFVEMMKPGMNGVPIGYDHFGIRMKLSTVGFDAKNLRVNGRLYDENFKDDNVLSLYLTHQTGGINIEFPNKYNIGKDQIGFMETFQVQVRVTRVGGGVVQDSQDGQDGSDPSGSTPFVIYIDYLFESADITSDENGDTWFIYDPLVTPLQPGAEDPHKVNTAANSPAVTEMKEVEENNKENTVVKAAEVIQRKAASEEESAAQVTAAKDAGVAISELAKAKSNELQARKEVEAAHEAEVQAIALKNKKDQESTQATAEATNANALYTNAKKDETIAVAKEKETFQVKKEQDDQLKSIERQTKQFNLDQVVKEKKEQAVTAAKAAAKKQLDAVEVLKHALVDARAETAAALKLKKETNKKVIALKKLDEEEKLKVEELQKQIKETMTAETTQKQAMKIEQIVIESVKKATSFTNSKKIEADAALDLAKTYQQTQVIPSEKNAAETMTLQKEVEDRVYKVKEREAETYKAGKKAKHARERGEKSVADMEAKNIYYMSKKDQDYYKDKIAKEKQFVLKTIEAEKRANLAETRANDAVKSASSLLDVYKIDQLSAATKAKEYAQKKAMLDKKAATMKKAVDDAQILEDKEKEKLIKIQTKVEILTQVQQTLDAKIRSNSNGISAEVAKERHNVAAAANILSDISNYEVTIKNAKANELQAAAAVEKASLEYINKNAITAAALAAVLKFEHNNTNTAKVAKELMLDSIHIDASEQKSKNKEAKDIEAEKAAKELNEIKTKKAEVAAQALSKANALEKETKKKEELATEKLAAASELRIRKEHEAAEAVEVGSLSSSSSFDPAVSQSKSDALPTLIHQEMGESTNEDNGDSTNVINSGGSSDRDIGSGSGSSTSLEAPTVNDNEPDMVATPTIQSPYVTSTRKSKVRTKPKMTTQQKVEKITTLKHILERMKSKNIGVNGIDLESDLDSESNSDSDHDSEKALNIDALAYLIQNAVPDVKINLSSFGLKKTAAQRKALRDSSSIDLKNVKLQMTTARRVVIQAMMSDLDEGEGVYVDPYETGIVSDTFAARLQLQGVKLMYVLSPKTKVSDRNCNQADVLLDRVQVSDAYAVAIDVVGEYSLKCLNDVPLSKVQIVSVDKELGTKSYEVSCWTNEEWSKIGTFHSGDHFTCDASGMYENEIDYDSGTSIHCLTVPPEHGELGNCGTTLNYKSECRQTCDEGYTLIGGAASCPTGDGMFVSSICQKSIGIFNDGNGKGGRDGRDGTMNEPIDPENLKALKQIELDTKAVENARLSSKSTLAEESRVVDDIKAAELKATELLRVALENQKIENAAKLLAKEKNEEVIRLETESKIANDKVTETTRIANDHTKFQLAKAASEKKKLEAQQIGVEAKAAKLKEQALAHNDYILEKDKKNAQDVKTIADQKTMTFLKVKEEARTAEETSVVMEAQDRQDQKVADEAKSAADILTTEKLRAIKESKAAEAALVSIQKKSFENKKRQEEIAGVVQETKANELKLRAESKEVEDKRIAAKEQLVTDQNAAKNTRSVKEVKLVKDALIAAKQKETKDLQSAEKTKIEFEQNKSPVTSDLHIKSEIQVTLDQKEIENDMLLLAAKIRQMDVDDSRINVQKDAIEAERQMIADQQSADETQINLNDKKAVEAKTKAELHFAQDTAVIADSILVKDQNKVEAKKAVVEEKSIEVNNIAQEVADVNKKLDEQARIAAASNGNVNGNLADQKLVDETKSIADAKALEQNKVIEEAKLAQKALHDAETKVETDLKISNDAKSLVQQENTEEVISIELVKVAQETRMGAEQHLETDKKVVQKYNDWSTKFNLDIDNFILKEDQQRNAKVQASDLALKKNQLVSDEKELENAKSIAEKKHAEETKLHDETQAAKDLETKLATAFTQDISTVKSTHQTLKDKQVIEMKAVADAKAARDQAEKTANVAANSDVATHQHYLDQKIADKARVEAGVQSNNEEIAAEEVKQANEMHNIAIAQQTKDQTLADKSQIDASDKTSKEIQVGTEVKAADVVLTNAQNQVAEDQTAVNAIETMAPVDVATSVEGNQEHEGDKEKNQKTMTPDEQKQHDAKKKEVADKLQKLKEDTMNQDLVRVIAEEKAANALRVAIQFKAAADKVRKIAAELSKTNDSQGVQQLNDAKKQKQSLLNEKGKANKEAKLAEEKLTEITTQVTVDKKELSELAGRNGGSSSGGAQAHDEDGKDEKPTNEVAWTSLESRTAKDDQEKNSDIGIDGEEKNTMTEITPDVKAVKQLTTSSTKHTVNINGAENKDVATGTSNEEEEEEDFSNYFGTGTIQPISISTSSSATLTTIDSQPSPERTQTLSPKTSSMDDLFSNNGLDDLTSNKIKTDTSTAATAEEEEETKYGILEDQNGNFISHEMINLNNGDVQKVDSHERHNYLKRLGYVQNLRDKTKTKTQTEGIGPTLQNNSPTIKAATPIEHSGGSDVIDVSVYKRSSGANGGNGGNGGDTGDIGENEKTSKVKSSNNDSELNNNPSAIAAGGNDVEEMDHRSGPRSGGGDGGGGLRRGVKVSVNGDGLYAGKTGTLKEPRGTSKKNEDMWRVEFDDGTPEGDVPKKSITVISSALGEEREPEHSNDVSGNQMNDQTNKDDQEQNESNNNTKMFLVVCGMCTICVVVILLFVYHKKKTTRGDLQLASGNSKDNDDNKRSLVGADELIHSDHDASDIESGVETINPFLNDLESEKNKKSNLPNNWKQHVDKKSGKTYYHNKATNKTSWERPQDSAAAEKKVPTLSKKETAYQAQQRAMLEVKQRNLTNERMKKNKEKMRNKNKKKASAKMKNKFATTSNKNTEKNKKKNLPDNWKELVDEKSGKKYFYNVITKETSWERPPDLQEGWTEFMDVKTKKPYWGHRATGKTTWDKPVKKN